MPHEIDPMDRIQPVIVTTRMILSHFPSAAGVASWIELRRQHIEHLRQLLH